MHLSPRSSAGRTLFLFFARVEPKWLAKGKALAAFRSAIVCNEELENIVHGYKLSEEEAKEPNVIIKHLQEHFMASEGVLTERKSSPK